MNKKKFAVLALLMIVVLMLTSCLLVACNPDNSSDGNDQSTIKATEGLLINNSDFKVVDTSVTTYPRGVTSWTGAKMYSSGTFRDDVIAGVINLEEAVYNANKSKWKDENNEIRNKLMAGGKFGENDKIKNTLMIYMPEESKNADGNKINGPTAYGYTSTSFSLEKGSYYKLSVDVLTHNIGGENEADRGARIYVSSNTYAEFSGIDTQGTWQTYTVYVETSPSASTSLTLMLGLGKYSSYYTKGLTSGYAFFDNVVLEKLSDTDDKTATEQFNDALELEKDSAEHVATTTLKVPNGRFDFGSTTLSSSGAPSNWSLVTGNSGKDDPAPTSLGYNAVIDLKNFATDCTKYSSTFNIRTGEGTANQEYVPAESLKTIAEEIGNYGDRVGSNAFMLSQQLMTAQGIRSSRTITIEKNKVYALSIDLYTYGIHGAGVSLILTGSDGKDIVIKGISSQKEADYYYIGNQRITPDTGYTNASRDGNSTNGWRTYTFYIKGNQFRDFSYNMAIWLGTDGTNDNHSTKYHSFTSSTTATTYDANGTFSNGWVFIDDLMLEDIGALPLEGDAIVKGDNQTLDCSIQDAYRGIIVDLTSENLFGEGDSYILSDAQATNAPSLKADGIDVAVVGGGAPKGWTSNFDTTKPSNPIISGTITEGIVNIASESLYNGPANTYPGLPYDIVSKNAYVMHASKESYYEVETEKFTIEANQFYRISMWIKTVDVASTSGAYVYLVDKSSEDDATLTSITKINTKDLDDYLNDWCEVSIVVRGAQDKATDVALKFTLGTGNRWAHSTLTSGALFVSNINRSTISYANFNDTTSGTYVKTVDMSESFNYEFQNGSFDDYDLDDDNLEANKPLTEQTVPAKPDDFTISDNTVNVSTPEDDNALFAGVIALNKVESGLDFASSNQATSVTGINESVFNNFYGNDGKYENDYLNSLAGPNMLAIGSRNPAKKYAIGYASTSVTLSANKFYQLSVYAKTVGDTKASIFLSGESSASTGVNYFFIEENNNNGDWTKYTFFIEVGNASVSVKLNLWLGRDVNLIDDSEIGSDVAEEDKETAKEELAKSSGAVFFDNIGYKEIEENVYNEATANDNNKKISFLTDSFDTLSTTIESRSTLSSPNGWSGAAGANQSSSNSKVGVAYADDSYYDTEIVEQTNYSRLLGLDYKLDDIEITDEELAEAKAKPENKDKSDEDLISELKDQKLVDQKKANWIPVKELVAHSGNRMLVINNTKESAYIYTSSSNTLKANSFYEISVWVRTYGLSGRDGDDTIGANVELYLGSANETDNPFIFKSINTQVKAEDDTVTNDWKEFKFFVQTKEDDVTSVTIKLSLGSYSSEDIDGETIVSGLTSGYALFDDVSIQQVDEATYEGATVGDTVQKRQVKDETQGEANKPQDPDSETPKSKFNLDYLWWMIPTIVIGLVIIIVVIVFVIRKLRKPGVKKAIKSEKAPQNAEMLDKKHSKYDEGKE